jgi:carbon-monoxide dehydrogenase large subunit
MSAQQSATQDANSADFRFGSERHALRSEDAPLVTGRGKFTDDLDMTGKMHAAFVRATVAHAIIRKVDVAGALKMPGVVAIITGSDLAADNIGGIPPVASFNGRDGNPMFHATMRVLAAARVR